MTNRLLTVVAAITILGATSCGGSSGGSAATAPNDQGTTAASEQNSVPNTSQRPPGTTSTSKPTFDRAAVETYAHEQYAILGPSDPAIVNLVNVIETTCLSNDDKFVQHVQTDGGLDYVKLGCGDRLASITNDTSTKLAQLVQPCGGYVVNRSKSWAVTYTDGKDVNSAVASCVVDALHDPVVNTSFGAANCLAGVQTLTSGDFEVRFSYCGSGSGSGVLSVRKL